MSRLPENKGYHKMIRSFWIWIFFTLTLLGVTSASSDINNTDTQARPRIIISREINHRQIILEVDLTAIELGELMVHLNYEDSKHKNTNTTTRLHVQGHEQDEPIVKDNFTRSNQSIAMWTKREKMPNMDLAPENDNRTAGDSGIKTNPSEEHPLRNTSLQNTDLPMVQPKPHSAMQNVQVPSTDSSFAWLTGWFTKLPWNIFLYDGMDYDLPNDINISECGTNSSKEHAMLNTSLQNTGLFIVRPKPLSEKQDVQVPSANNFTWLTGWFTKLSWNIFDDVEIADNFPKNVKAYPSKEHSMLNISLQNTGLPMIRPKPLSTKQGIQLNIKDNFFFSKSVTMSSVEKPCIEYDCVEAAKYVNSHDMSTESAITVVNLDDIAGSMDMMYDYVPVLSRVRTRFRSGLAHGNKLLVENVSGKHHSAGYQGNTSHIRMWDEVFDTMVMLEMIDFCVLEYFFTTCFFKGIIGLLRWLFEGTLEKERERMRKHSKKEPQAQPKQRKRGRKQRC